MFLTPRQMDIVLAIRNHRHVKGYPPTFRELAALVGISRVTTVQHVKALIKKGIIRKQPHQARTLEVVADDSLVKPAAA